MCLLKYALNCVGHFSDFEPDYPTSGLLYLVCPVFVQSELIFFPLDERPRFTLIFLNNDNVKVFLGLIKNTP
jgi:hypothetical protein